MVNPRLDAKTLGKVLAKVWPADAGQDAEMQRLLENVERQCEKKGAASK